MDNENQQSFTYDMAEDSEYEPETRTPSLPVRIVTGIGTAMLAAAAGYLIGWGIALILERIANGAGS